MRGCRRSTIHVLKTYPFLLQVIHNLHILLLEAPKDPGRPIISVVHALKQQALHHSGVPRSFHGVEVTPLGQNKANIVQEMECD